ncbi:ABC transporter, ATP-binding protein [Parvularcula bermudensis HTCC2503]|uniref:ABC transporter, ATP-binding protein n=1 Tax=Parvularcula bermudensis (strain ATCC BAA-594 / HTCC2503 / KCTC 12087) TaxID=314260 RepID=E0TIF6_PARBH|nr:ATP-binding cassette domain-containing protein [Parvularcula bermudensis]ADM10275.1 ABC transporter, ATP-binding protein [Parvularcula bermudensis HTCC2503]
MTEAPVYPIELQAVTKQYGRHIAVEELSFCVKPGEIFGFLGQNGAGKTTTLRMIMDIIAPSAGKVMVMGNDRPRLVRNQVGYLPEERGLYRKMKALDTIAYFARLKGVPRGVARRRAAQLLDDYGLGAQAKSKIETLSKGMAQKIQVLSTIAHDPDILVFDEPFSGLDPVNQQVLEDLITTLRDRGKTIIFSTHIMEHAERLCDRFLMLRKGRKVFEGTLDEARALEPSTLILQTPDDPLPLLDVPGVEDIVARDRGRYRLVVREDTDRQAILRRALDLSIRIESFGEEEFSLHDLFFRLAAAPTAVSEEPRP